MGDIEIGVVGGGLMGIGIAVKFALANYRTTVIETDSNRFAHVRCVAKGILDELADVGIVEVERSNQVLGALRVSSDLQRLARAGLVVEAIPEKLDAKHSLFEQLEAILPSDAIIASNTSGFLPDLLAERMHRKARFLIAHFWNPPHLIPLVEVVPGTATDPATVAQVVACLSDIDAKPVVLTTAIPGFIGNRLQFAVLREALNIVRSGAATPDVVDMVMKESLGRRYRFVGPLEGADLGGLGTFLSIATHLMPELAKDETVLDLLRSHTERGDLGASTGQGFYRWDERRLETVRTLRRQLLTSR